MNFKIIVSDNFRKEAKRLIKKFASLKTELTTLEQTLSNNPTEGTPLGNNCYKIRLKVSSKNKGKSGGMRIIALVVTISKNIYLLSIYDKSEQADINAKELQQLIKQVQ
ncbi:MAG: type II toxin-antitoxin system RelE/ParE family toxin [Chitinophagaceae bacterium]|nr:type II toxin-antitoxin system RelE/ParE family toxin [Chitinophagaceae bacterium]